MTRDERLAAGERILRALFSVPESEMDARDVVRQVVDAAYPELRLRSGTHWVAPREMTAPAFRVAIAQVVNARPLAITDEVAGYLWSAARDAYLKQEGGKP